MDKILKIGVFGVFRGADYCRELQKIPNAKVVAICDNNQAMIDNCMKYVDPDVRIFNDYDEMLDFDIDAVILCNTFDKHTPASIKAFKKGKAVLTETTPCATLKECVELVEAAEKYNAVYALAENYPYIRGNKEMRRVYQTGILGNVSFAEGEYVHPMDPKLAVKYQPTPHHWRSYLPCTYYCTHALSPLMFMTDHMPKKVMGKQALNEDGDVMGGLMLVETDRKALFRIFGSAHFGCMENWYRLGCDRGEVENVRGSNDMVRLVLNPWQRVPGTENMGDENMYYPETTEVDMIATNSGKRTDDHGHWGGDQWMIRTFVDDVLEGRTPYMNVYRAAALSAVGIIGWYSILDGSTWMDIPDFTKKEDRDKVRDDDRNPFPDKDLNTSLPSVYHQD
ncbi:MAG: Gfo/Idh/MocA family oxidoreductase [Lachnospiraceae bacterium]|nr:Gfo/Idh/MocA family oxidoreductase [Lachnospiraceae bacterium]